MLSSISAIVRPSDAVTVIVPWLTANRPDTCFPSVSWKLIFSLMLHFYRRPRQIIRSNLWIKIACGADHGAHKGLCIAAMRHGWLIHKGIASMSVFERC